MSSLLLSMLVTAIQTARGQDCGRFFLPKEGRSDKMIVGGQEAPAGLFPWVVALQYKNHQGVLDTLCSGSIISKDFVLTAATCFLSSMFPVERINAGSIVHNRTQSAHSIVEVWIHSRNRDTSNIAIVQVKPSFIFTDGTNGDGAILPICLPRVSEQFYGNVTIPGWGIESYDEEYDYNCSLTLRYVNAIIMNNDLCAVHSTWFKYVSYFCTTSIHPNLEEGPCYGDFGSPVVGVSNGLAYLVGIVAGHNKGQMCYSETNPSIHAKVASFRAWIFLRTLI